MAQALGQPVDWFLSEPSRGPQDPMRAIRHKRAAVLRVARKHGARSIRVFGSAARGDARPDSDIDLLVEMEPGRSLFDQAALLLDLTDLLGRDVDVVTPEGLRDRIRERVLREAVAL